jgi:hypothetical protein
MERGLMRCVLVMVLAATLGLAGSASAATFADAAGDGNGAPDITAVDVTNDATGAVTIRLTVPGGASNAQFFALLDTDRNSATGASESLGAEYAIHYDSASRTSGIDRWDGSQWLPSAYSTLDVSSDASSVTISVNIKEIGRTTAFGVWTRSLIGDASAGMLDDAPDDGVYSYTVALAPDSSPPHVKALPSGGRAGSEIRLRYEVYDDLSLETYERIRVLRPNGTVIWTRTVSYGESEQGTDYWVGWRPGKQRVGLFRFCVESWDESRNKSAPSCARVRVRPG